MGEKKFTTLYDKQGTAMRIPVRKGISVDDPRARYTGFRQETQLLKKAAFA